MLYLFFQCKTKPFTSNQPDLAIADSCTHVRAHVGVSKYSPKNLGLIMGESAAPASSQMMQSMEEWLIHHEVTAIQRTSSG